MKLPTAQIPKTLMAIAALALCLPPLEPQAQATGTAIIAGQVIDATTKRPVGGAVVTLSVPATPAGGQAGPATPGTAPAQTRRAAAVANAEGRFVFRDLPAGSYNLTATRNGYAPGAFGRRRPEGPSRVLTIAESARASDVVLSLWRLSTISGIVRDDRGEPVIGVHVTAMRRTMTGGRLELTFAGGSGEATDDRGHYRINGLQPGSYIVTIRTVPQSAAVSTVERYRTAAASGTSATLARELREGGALQMFTEGLVVDGWQVSIWGQLQPLPGPNGTLLISPMVFHANVTSSAEATPVTLAAGEDREGVDFAVPLVTGVRVSGTLVGPDGPAANHGVQLVPVAAVDPVYPFPTAYSITDAAGRFALLGVTPGSYVVRARRVPPTGPLFTPPPPTAGVSAGRETVTQASGPSFPAHFAEAPVTVGSASVDGVSLLLRPGGRISGSIRFEGAATPPAAAQLQRMTVLVRPLTNSEGQGAGGQTNVDASGGFQTPGYAPGRYLISAVPPASDWTLASVRVGGVDASDQAIALGTTDVTDVVVTFTDRITTLSGTVRSADGSADAEATVVAFPADFRAWLATGMSPRRMAMTATSATGAYQLRIGIAGDYLVVAIPPEIAPEIDLEFMKRFATSATRVTFVTGDARTLSLSVSRVR